MELRSESGQILARKSRAKFSQTRGRLNHIIGQPEREEANLAPFGVFQLRLILINCHGNATSVAWAQKVAKTTTREGILAFWVTRTITFTFTFTCLLLNSAKVSSLLRKTAFKNLSFFLSFSLHSVWLSFRPSKLIPAVAIIAWLAFAGTKLNQVKVSR